jgi:hypothetical protein
MDAGLDERQEIEDGRWEMSRKTAKACSRFGRERSEVARRAEGAGGAPESTWEVEAVGFCVGEIP